jgi:antitoxin (DNA-binding transcriptional repressor) of toxin-antitoxin stability system
MKFVSIRELRSKIASIRRDLAQAREIVLTANGRPFAVMTPVSADTVEEEIQAIRRARTRAAIDGLRVAARAAGVDKLTMEDIDAEIAVARRARRKRQ